VVLVVIDVAHQNRLIEQDLCEGDFDTSAGAATAGLLGEDAPVAPPPRPRACADFARDLRAAVDALANVVAMTDLRLGTPREESGAGTTAAAYRHAVFVPVTFTLQQRAATSMHDGPTVWGYLLARNTAADPWLIVDQGPV
jgi:hypothetical protein